jgi:hypothetical protein
MSEPQQHRFFCAIFALPLERLHIGHSPYYLEKPAITIHTSALLDALADLNTSVQWLHLSNVDLSKQPDIEALSKVVAKQEKMSHLVLEHVEFPINCSKHDKDGAVGCLDPLLYAASCLKRLNFFGLSPRTPPSHSSLVSPKALRALVGKARTMRWLDLNGLGLNDSHCLAITDEWLASMHSVNVTGPDEQHYLNLTGNPAISAEGYSAFLSLLNRVSAVPFNVDDKHWQAKLNLVSQMNRDYGRLEYMTNGTFTSERHRLQWLQKLANLPSSSDKEERKHANFIWYELLEHPEFMRT